MRTRRSSPICATNASASTSAPPATSGSASTPTTRRTRCASSGTPAFSSPSTQTIRPLFGTDLNNEYEILVDHFDFTADELAQASLNGVAASTLPEAEKSALDAEFREEIAGLRAELHCRARLQGRGSESGDKEMIWLLSPHPHPRSVGFRFQTTHTERLAARREMLSVPHHKPVHPLQRFLDLVLRRRVAHPHVPLAARDRRPAPAHTRPTSSSSRVIANSSDVIPLIRISGKA